MYITTFSKTTLLLFAFVLISGAVSAQKKMLPGGKTAFSANPVSASAVAAKEHTKAVWGDEMSYAGDTTCVASISGNGQMTWGAKFPYLVMGGRNYLENVKVYCHDNGHYTLSIYQTTPGTRPSDLTLRYRHNYEVQAVDDYITLPIYDYIAIDSTKDLWVAFSCFDVLFPATATYYCGVPEGSYVYYDGDWRVVFDIEGAETLVYTWMIKATTSAELPPLKVYAEAPAMGRIGDSLRFTAVGPAEASYRWILEGAEDSVLIGQSVSTLWGEAGTYQVVLIAEAGAYTATDTMTVDIISCTGKELPFTCGFEPDEDMSCWTFVDADADGLGWCSPAYYFPVDLANSGSDCIGSASYINSIGPLTPDNWMITPELSIPEAQEGMEAVLRYAVGGVDSSYFDEHYSVVVSKDGPELDNFIYEIFCGKLDSRDWQQKNFSLSEFAGQNIHIAFHHYNSTDIFWMLIDDLVVDVVPEGSVGIEKPATVSVSLYPNPTTGELRIDAADVQSVAITDANGREVMSAGHADRLDVSQLADGIYFVRVVTPQGIATKKFLKK